MDFHFGSLNPTAFIGYFAAEGLRLIQVKVRGAGACYSPNEIPIMRRCNMDLKEAIYTRRSVREFTADPVDEMTIHALIEAAVHAPSAVNQ